jgi:hypothetical protein
MKFSTYPAVRVVILDVFSIQADAAIFVVSIKGAALRVSALAVTAHSLA